MLEANGYVVLSFSSENNLERQQFIIDLLQRQQVDALAINPIPGHYETIKNALTPKTPIVIFNRFIREFPIDSVAFDFRNGTKDAIDSLVAKGKKRFYQLVRQDIYSGKERRNAFNSSLIKNHIKYKDSHTLLVNDDFQSGYTQMKNLIKSRKKVDAVLCSSDFTALGAIRCCFENKLKIPQDISIVGTYNCSLAQFTYPGISSINADFELMAGNIVDLLLKKLSRKEEKEKDNQDLSIYNISIQTTFLQRETTWGGL